MPFDTGDRLGPYEILSQIGAGGMGEVWRARDTRLNREVAIKVLPAGFAADPQYMARFEREAQTLAALHHPNIATVFGVEGHALVMELVDGPTLADRISQGALPMDEALPIAREIVEALEAAHERGIIHRDLKPANIKLTSTGTVKLLDFGLAKAAGDLAARAPGSHPTMSPTLSLAMTQAGMILGTAAYMSPEQARGRPVDRRADIWSFGVVFWEMLTGRQLFGGGETVTDTLASVVKDTPDLAALPATTPPNVRHIIERCLRKDPRTRLRDIGEARVLLDEPVEASPVRAVPAAAVAASRWPLLTAGIIVAGVCAVCLAILAVIHFREAPPKPAPLVRLEITVPPSGSVGRFLSISPDGKTLAWADGGNIYVRAIDAFEPRLLTPARVEGYLFWSPDGRQLGFQAEGKLKRIPVAGGPVQTICECGNALGTAWTNDDKLIIGGMARGLLRVPVSGGTTQPVKVIGAPKDVTTANWPVLLPGGKKLMYATTVADRSAVIMVADLQPDGSIANPREVVAARHGAQYLTDASGRGHIVFVRGASLMAQSFDPDAVKLSGDPFVITEAVGIYLTRAFFAVANGGTIAFRTGESVGVRAEFVDRSGKSDIAMSTPGSLRDLMLSPDGRSIVAVVTKGDGANSIWVLDPERGAHTRITFDDVSARGPIWSPDGKRVAYWSRGLWVKPANGSGTAEKIAPAGLIVWSWSHDGKHLLVSLGVSTDSQPGLFLLPLDGDRKPLPLVASKFVLTQAQFSPDDHWVAYVSDESGESEVYVQRVPATGERIRISNSGGFQPRWRRDGRELFYAEPRGKLMAVALRYGKTLEADAPVPLFEARLSSLTPTASTRYDVTPDGKHFYVSRFPEAQSTSPLRVILNWPGVTK